MPELLRIQIIHNFYRQTSLQLVTQLRATVILCFENGKVLVCRETFFSDNLLAWLTKLVAAAKPKNHVEKCYFHNQHTRDNEFDRFQVVICINRLRVHAATIQWTYVGSLQALTSHSTFADTRNILVVFPECDRTPHRGSDFCFYIFTNSLKFILILS